MFLLRLSSRFYDVFAGLVVSVVAVVDNILKTSKEAPMTGGAIELEKRYGRLFYLRISTIGLQAAV